VLLWVKGVVRHQRGEAAVIRIAAEAASVRAGRKLGDDRELLEETLGPEHPRVASVRRELAHLQAPGKAR
jgi:hypothetical protein